MVVPLVDVVGVAVVGVVLLVAEVCAPVLSESPTDSVIVIACDNTVLT